MGIHIALASLLQKESITAPIIGATKMSHLKDAVGALSIKVNKGVVLKNQYRRLPALLENGVLF